MHKSQISTFLLSVTCLIAGCAVAPTTIVKTPTTAKAVDVLAANPTPGAIYNVATSRALFEDRRPRMVGDILTVNIVENTNASKDGGSSGSKKGSVATSITSLGGVPLPSASVGAESDLSYEDSAAEDAKNTFSGSLTATVTEVLPNGNLAISGEKQVAFDKQTEYVRFSGVVNPDTITFGNNVASTKVADARIEYRTGSKFDAAQVLSILARFFLSIGL